MTTLSIDTGDLDVLKRYASTGLITDATTNPLFVTQAAFKGGDQRYEGFVNEALEYARNQAAATDTLRDTTNLAMDRLAVNLGAEIIKLVPGYVSTEVDIRESFDTSASIARALRLIHMYENDHGVPRSRILIKLAATWEGIKAAEVLERDHGISCNLTLVFGLTQAVACGQAKVRLISPFPGRILDWHKANKGFVADKHTHPQTDPGVVAVRQMYEYYQAHGHANTICMPASWRPSRGAEDPAFSIDEVVALAGVDRMTIPPPLLDALATCTDPLPRVLEPGKAKQAGQAGWPVPMDQGSMSEKTFRTLMCQDEAATAKLAEGINAFVSETEKLRALFEDKLASTP